MTSLTIDIRPAKRSDAVGLAEVHEAAWREAYSGLIPGVTLEAMIRRRGPRWWREMMGRRAMLVLRVGGETAGYLTFARAPQPGEPAAAEIQELYLRPEYQGIGLGLRLFATAVRAVREKGYGRVLVRVLAENERAVRFYERRGGRLVARSEERLGGRALACLWYEFPA